MQACSAGPVGAMRAGGLVDRLDRADDIASAAGQCSLDAVASTTLPVRGYSDFVRSSGSLLLVVASTSEETKGRSVCIHGFWTTTGRPRTYTARLAAAAVCNCIRKRQNYTIVAKGR